LGRYINSDPLGLEAGFNTYLYGFSNSLKFVDPLGLDNEPADGFMPFFGRRDALAFGKKVHDLFSEYVESRGLDADMTCEECGFGPRFRPDAFDRSRRKIWELKPWSYQVWLPRYNRGQKQIQKYIDKATAQGKMGWARGSDARIFPDGRTDAHIGYVEHDGSWYEIFIFADSGKWTKKCKVQGLKKGNTQGKGSRLVIYSNGNHIVW
jgi:hypothetical protein